MAGTTTETKCRGASILIVIILAELSFRDARSGTGALTSASHKSATAVMCWPSSGRSEHICLRGYHAQVTTTGDNHGWLAVYSVLRMHEPKCACLKSCNIKLFSRCRGLNIDSHSLFLFSFMFAEPCTKIFTDAVWSLHSSYRWSSTGSTHYILHLKSLSAHSGLSVALHFSGCTIWSPLGPTLFWKVPLHLCKAGCSKMCNVCVGHIYRTRLLGLYFCKS